MKPISLELMKEYQYLSNLLAWKKGLLYTSTKADLENNDYTQDLHYLNPETKEDKILLAQQKRIPVYKVGEEILVVEKTETEFTETKYKRLNEAGELEEGFALPLEISDIRLFDENTYAVIATIQKDCPNYFELDEGKKKEYHEHLKKENDYLILDEYPFFYNGAGFINGTRDNLFLVDKNSLKITRVGEVNMAVESLEIIGDKLYILGNVYESMKRMYASIYSYEPKTGKLEEIYHNETAYISKLVSAKGKLYALASFDTCISGQHFFEVKDGELKEVCASEWMFYNSIGSDCRYGKTHGSIKHQDATYLITTDQERSIVVKFDGEKLTPVTDGEGSCDDLAFVDDELYVIAMKEMKLQEVYHAPDFKQLTTINEAVLEDHYVAKPERFTFFNVDDIVGYVLKPIDFDENKTYPCILDIHGGPKTAYGEVFYHEMQLWASLGYFVIFCNPHCSDGRGDDFANYIKHYGATDYDDIMAFVDEALVRYPQIDKERLAVTGGSYGGYMTNWIITHTDRFKAAASQRSISNRVADLYYSDYAYDVTYENGIPLDENAIKLFWERSPLKYVDNAVTPTLFIQSTEDYRCPFPEAVQLFSALKWKGVETKVCGFKGENHELSRSGKPLHRLRRLQEITDWLVKYTK